MKIYMNGRIAHYKEMFPNVSFPASGPSDQFLAREKAYKVSSFKDHNRETQKLVPCDPVVKNGFAYVVKVVNKTEEEIAADLASKAAKLRAQRDAALKASDWTQGKDIPNNVSEPWAVYRQALRDLPDHEDFPNIDLPHDPDYVEPTVE